MSRNNGYYKPAGSNGYQQQRPNQGSSNANARRGSDLIGWGTAIPEQYRQHPRTGQSNPSRYEAPGFDDDIEAEFRANEQHLGSNRQEQARGYATYTTPQMSHQASLDPQQKAQEYNSQQPVHQANFYAQQNAQGYGYGAAGHGAGGYQQPGQYGQNGYQHGNGAGGYATSGMNQSGAGYGAALQYTQEGAARDPRYGQQGHSVSSSNNKSKKY
jgi:hypothetical protein